MSKTYIIKSNDGDTVIAPRVSKDDMLWLRGLDDQEYTRLDQFGTPVVSMVRVHRKNDLVWFSNVDGSIIKAELQRHIRDNPPSAEDNRTVGRTQYVDRHGQAGWYFEHRIDRCLRYPSYAPAVAEMTAFILRSSVDDLAHNPESIDGFERWFNSFDAPTLQPHLDAINGKLRAYRHDRIALPELIESLVGIVAHHDTPAA